MLIELIFCIGLSAWDGPEFLNCTRVHAKGERCPTEADLAVIRHSYLAAVIRNNRGNPKYSITGKAHVDLVSCAMPDTAT
jgi:hypothetical protein